MAEAGKSSDSETVMETVVIVRPIKVIGMMLSAFALLLMVLAVAATAWIEASSIREGLWQRCLFRLDEENKVDCEENLDKAEWRRGCQGLFLLAITLTFVGVVVVSLGLRGDNSQKKFRLYMAGCVIWIAAVVFQVIALIIYPVKVMDEIEDKPAAKWQFGWSYGLSWAAAVCVVVGAILVFIDRSAVEIEEKEVILKKEGLEEEQATEPL